MEDGRVKRNGQLGPGAKSIARGSTFASRGTGLRRTSTPKPRRAISEASPAQRAKVANAVSIVSSQGPCDPAHLWPRGRGGCDHPDCVVPLTREEHAAFDEGRLDLLPYLIDPTRGAWEELAHMIEVHQV